MGWARVWGGGEGGGGGKGSQRFEEDVFYRVNVDNVCPGDCQGNYA